MKKTLHYSLLLILATLVSFSCKKNNGNPPELPPYESMVIDFSNFTSLKKSAVAFNDTKGTETSTWDFAANLANVWNSLISLSIPVPMAGFQAASAYKPSFVSDNLWQWSYDFTQDGKTYKSKLQGKISSGSVTWSMYVTYEGTGGFNDFLWLEGTSKSDGSGGQWKFRQSPSADVQLFLTDWTKSGDVITAVVYTYSKSDANKDSYINFHLDSSGYDAGYTIHFADGLYSDSEIEWNITTRDGRLKCLDYLQDENWYCWDTNKINKVCD
jgi:hypothetical protein